MSVGLCLNSGITYQLALLSLVIQMLVYSFTYLFCICYFLVMSFEELVVYEFRGIGGL